MKGGYSTALYPQWHQNKADAETEIKLKCLMNNIVMTSLTNWWYDFRDISLIRF
jgi:hypothetical protein